ncbi:MAG: stage II sporulation protein D [Oscillospiraceae bacterium]|nr:stage II sporulation protein D [Oscillospiraceae bacterium]
MPASFHEEALKAQAIAARTYTIFTATNSRTHENADICDNFACCQAWISKEERFERWNEEERESNWERIVRSVNDTRGKIVMFEGRAAGTFYHANSGGKTEAIAYVWGPGNHPYLQAVETSGEYAYTQYSSEVVLSKEEVIQKIREHHGDIAINFEEERPIEILEYTAGGRVRTIRFGNINLSGVEARRIFGLRSARFIVEITDENVRFDVRGYGHGVGLSQTGADSLARQGMNYEQIIKHFFSGVEIVDI